MVSVVAQGPDDGFVKGERRKGIAIGLTDPVCGRRRVEVGRPGLVPGARRITSGCDAWRERYLAYPNDYRRMGGSAHQLIHWTQIDERSACSYPIGGES